MDCICSLSIMFSRYYKCKRSGIMSEVDLERKKKVYQSERSQTKRLQTIIPVPYDENMSLGGTRVKSSQNTHLSWLVHFL